MRGAVLPVAVRTLGLLVVVGTCEALGTRIPSRTGFGLYIAVLLLVVGTVVVWAAVDAARGVPAVRGVGTWAAVAVAFVLIATAPAALLFEYEHFRVEPPDDDMLLWAAGIAGPAAISFGLVGAARHVLPRARSGRTAPARVGDWTRGGRKRPGNDPGAFTRPGPAGPGTPRPLPHAPSDR